MTIHAKARALTAAEFFAKGFHGFSKTDAKAATRLSYSAIHDATLPGKSARPRTLRLLQDWSLAAVEEHGAYLSASATAGIAEPTVHDIRTAKAV